jgi:hypothetical protein
MNCKLREESGRGLIPGRRTIIVAAGNFSMEEGEANSFVGRGETRKFAYKLTIKSLNANSTDHHKIVQHIFKKHV